MSRAAAIALLPLLIWSSASSAAKEDVKPTLEPWDRLVGNWNCLVRSPIESGGYRETRSTWHWRRALGGRALQDEYIGQMPPKGEPFRGTALRLLDPETNRWDIAWIDSRSPTIKRFTAVSGPDSVTMHKAGGVDPTWQTRFYEISSDRFRWSTEPAGGEMTCQRATRSPTD